MKRKSDKSFKIGAPGEIIKRKVNPKEAVHKGEDPDRFHPFRVHLLVQDWEVLPESLREVIYYVRGPKKRPDLVLSMADQLWQKWEKYEKGITSAYPDTMGHGHAEFVDEDDFNSAWKEVQKYKLEARVAGEKKDPMAFTCIGRTDI